MKKIFKNKKGIGAEVDWIIAGGIFLIYLLMTIVYFKPGITPVHNPDNLLDIVEENFMRDVQWKITSQALFLQAIPFSISCGSGATATTKVTNMANGKDCNNLDYNLNSRTKTVSFGGEYKVENAVISPTTNSATFPVFLSAKNLKEENMKIFFVGRTTNEPSKTGYEEAKADDCNERKEKLEGKKIELIAKIGYGTEPITKSQCKKVLESIKEKSSEFEEPTLTEKEELCKDFMEIVTEEESLECLGASDDKDKYVTPEEYIPTEDELRPYYVNFRIEGNNQLIFTPFFVPYPKIDIPTKTIYMLTYSNDVINLETPLPPAISADDNACIILGYDPAIITQQTCHAKYELGVPETSTGVSLRKIDLYKQLSCDGGSGYSCVKKLWGYPELKEFKVTIYGTKQDLIAEFPKEPIIPTNVNVYSRSFNSFVLNEDSVRTPAIISILVW